MGGGGGGGFELIGNGRKNPSGLLSVYPPVFSRPSHFHFQRDLIPFLSLPLSLSQFRLSLCLYQVSLRLEELCCLCLRPSVWLIYESHTQRIFDVPSIILRSLRRGARTAAAHEEELSILEGAGDHGRYGPTTRTHYSADAHRTGAQDWIRNAGRVQGNCRTYRRQIDPQKTPLNFQYKVTLSSRTKEEMECFIIFFNRPFPLFHYYYYYFIYLAIFCRDRFLLRCAADN